MTAPAAKIIGLLPAAGLGSRISPLPMSKELFPIGFQDLADQGLRPKVACQYLLEAMGEAGIQETFLILRPGKWDIPAYLGDGSQFNMRLAYVTVHVPFGVPFSLNQAYPFVKDAIVAMGFPDILFRPRDAYGQLLHRLQTGSADVVLGLFPTDQPEKVGLVDFDHHGVVSGIYEKSQLTHLTYMWAIAVWRPSFTEFLHRFVEAKQTALIGDQSPVLMREMPTYQETPIGDVIGGAIANNLRVEAIPFETGQYLDIGTPENLINAVYHYGKPIA
ncbi:nucleotidyltransferase family protein [Leptothoe sp. PORK10 BA2]|uniref:nucleotidyltransferase family protein n=1 Tax=Leptothoe sp. PORK10 BA2 TaxID=3110254 RepID=UPI002B21EA96|nr:sugar phosphate nucleotidyltransferase [Leptothoe sp. PORK10 BA2]MEA5466211.1 sugar phosphate nucleotidyltransferase [Leptothoe sp. PORK10 BA2]